MRLNPILQVGQRNKNFKPIGGGAAITKPTGFFYAQKMEEVIEYTNGKAEFRGYIYARAAYAYKVRAKTLGTHTDDEWINLCSKYDFRCCHCGCDVIGGIPTKDHIVPPRLRGCDSIDNLQPLCRQCNTSKGCSIIDYR